jgi:hypothetical protein
MKVLQYFVAVPVMILIRLLFTRHSAICLLIFLLTALFMSCEKLYWYRKKVRVDHPYLLDSSKAKDPLQIPVPIHIQLINHSQAYLSPDFEDGIRTYCSRALSRRGFIETTDTPVLNFVIQLKIDSFPVPYGRWLDPIYDGMKFGTTIREISLDYTLLFFQTDISYWTDRSAFYYFSRDERDLKRSRSMINYVTKQIPFHK